MKSPVKIIVIILLTISATLVILGVYKRIYYEKHVHPYLKQHAAITALLYYDTCILSDINIQKMEKNILNIGATPLTDTMWAITDKRWEVEPDTTLKDKLKSNPYPYFISLDETGIKIESDKNGIAKLRCTMRMHTGIGKEKSRPENLRRRSPEKHQNYLFAKYVRAILLSILKKNGAEIVDAHKPWWYSPRSKPTAFTLEGQHYHLDVSPFSVSLEYAEDNDCLSCD